MDKDHTGGTQGNDAWLGIAIGQEDRIRSTVVPSEIEDLPRLQPESASSLVG